MTSRSIQNVAYHRPRVLCLPRSYHEPAGREPLTEEQIELAMRLFREPPDRSRREDAAAIERELLAEARRAIGLAPMPRRR